MMKILIMLGLFMLIIGLICLFMDASGWAFFLGTMGAYSLSGGLMMYQENYKLTAMDMYQGKTKLLKLLIKMGLL